MAKVHYSLLTRDTQFMAELNTGLHVHVLHSEQDILISEYILLPPGLNTNTYSIYYITITRTY